MKHPSPSSTETKNDLVKQDKSPRRTRKGRKTLPLALRKKGLTVNIRTPTQVVTENKPLKFTPSATLNLSETTAAGKSHTAALSAPYFDDERNRAAILESLRQLKTGRFRVHDLIDPDSD